MRRAQVRSHARRTASGGTTTVHQHTKSFRHSGAQSRRSYRRAVRRQGFGQQSQTRKKKRKPRRNLAGRGWDNAKRAFWTWGPGKRRKVVAVSLGVFAVGQVGTYVGLQGIGGVATAIGVLGLGLGILARRVANASRGDS